MGFSAYTGSATIIRTSVVTVDCSTGANYTISFANTADGNGKYILQNTDTNTDESGHQLLVSFTNGGAAMTSGAATITGTGTGSANSTSHTITGSIASGQTGKTAGTYNATMTLNLVY
jgi:type 1 fimbria pilin